MFKLFFHIIENHSMIVSQYHEQCSYYSTIAWMLNSPLTTFPFQGWIKRNLITRISKSQSFGEASIKKKQFIYITSLFRNGHISWFSTSRKVCRYPTGKPHEGKAACQQTWGTVCSFLCPWSTLLHWTTVRQPWKWQEVWDTWWKRIGLKGRTTAVIHLLAKATRALPAGPLARKLASFCSHHL